jgi:hypothetical protein
MAPRQIRSRNSGWQVTVLLISNQQYFLNYAYCNVDNSDKNKDKDILTSNLKVGYGKRPSIRNFAAGS